MKNTFRNILIASIILLAGMPAFSDTLKLSDGSLLTGKIIKDQTESVVLSNAFGTFRIKKSEITENRITESYQDDIAIYRELNIKFSENEIRRHFTAGMDKKESLIVRKENEEKKTIQKKEESSRRDARESDQDDTSRWNSTRISFSGAYMYYLGKGNGSQPYGYSGFLSIDRGLDLRPGTRRPGMPGLRFEGGFIYFKQSSLKLQFYTASAGLMWALPSMLSRGGCFIFALMPGVAIFETGNDPLDLSSKVFKLSAQAIAGYQKSWGAFSIFLQARYLYVHDKNILFHSIGGEFGFGFNAL